MMGWPVVLILDVSGQAQSAAATARGFATLRPDLPFAGVVLNRVASPRHDRLIREGMDQAGSACWAACRVRATSPARAPSGPDPGRGDGGPAGHPGPCGRFHRGALRPGGDHRGRRPSRPARGARAAPLTPPGGRIALARDAAFSLVYPHVLEAWRRAGATILPFSPLADEGPDDSAIAAGCRGDTRSCTRPGWPPATGSARPCTLCGHAAVHGECGGYMALGAGLVDAMENDTRFWGFWGWRPAMPSAACIWDTAARSADALPGLGRTALRGHEFHYASILSQPDAPLARVTDATGAAWRKRQPPDDVRGRACVRHVLSPDRPGRDLTQALRSVYLTL